MPAPHRAAHRAGGRGRNRGGWRPSSALAFAPAGCRLALPGAALPVVAVIICLGSALLRGGRRPAEVLLLLPAEVPQGVHDGLRPADLVRRDAPRTPDRDEEGLARREPPQLREPRLHEGGLRVVAEPLAEHLVRAAFRVAADAREVPPVAPVAADVVVHQQPLEQLRSRAPVRAQVVGEHRDRQLPAAVRGVARRAQLPHRGVQQGQPGGPQEPPPPEPGVVLPPVARRQVRGALPVPGEQAPAVR
mmetsp:Transcript_75888/g.214597  ORF Transcript_75888/g.214597 Transcript_75888/m.214597 type:complete len:247 (-) Transcript_75888:1093-1833(-)